jgi:hypothetical protein
MLDKCKGNQPQDRYWGYRDEKNQSDDTPNQSDDTPNNRVKKNSSQDHTYYMFPTNLRSQILQCHGFCDRLSAKK